MELLIYGLNIKSLGGMTLGKPEDI